MIVRVKGIKRVRAKGRIYHYDRQSGSRILSAPGTPEFFREIERLRGATPPTVVRPGTLGGLINAYLGSPEFQGLAPRTRSDYQRIFDYLQKIEDIGLHQIDEAAVLMFRDKAFRQHKRRFANYVAQVFRLLFAWGKPRNLAPHLLAGVTMIRKPRDEPRRNPPWTDEECETVLNAAAGGIKVGIAIGRYTGMRQGDMLRLTWSAYDGHALHWAQGKTTGEVWLPVYSELRSILDEAVQTRRSVTIVANQSGIPYTGNGFRTLFNRLMRKLASEGKIRHGLTFHALRHTAGRWLEEAGCDTRTIASVLGQRTEAMARHYSDRGDQRRRNAAAIERLERKKPK